MKSLQKIKNVLSDVEITEEQQLALDEFFAELYENLQEKIKEEYQEEIELLQESLESSDEGREGWIRVEEAESAFNLAMSDAEKAFDLAMGDAESAFDLAMGDAEIAFENVQKDLIKEHSETMTYAMEDLYESLLEKAKEQLYESPEFENIQKIKAILAPSILEESNSVSLLGKVRKLEKQIEQIKEEKEQIELKNVVESLVEELPPREAKVVKKYISEATNVEEVYDRYNLAVSLLEAKDETEAINHKHNKPSLVTESLNSYDEDEDEDYDDEDEELMEALSDDDDYEDDDDDFEDEEDEMVTESFFNSKSNESNRRVEFNSIEEAIISKVFKK